MARRSVLFSPGDRPDMLRKAGGSGADVIVFDLEDAVAPPAKEAAREAVAEVLADTTFDPACEVFVRVNDLPTAREDVAAILDEDAAAPDGLVLPKVEKADDIEALSAAVTSEGVELPVFALIETATGVLRAESIGAAPATDALVFGAEDLAASLGATRTAEGTEVLYAREHVVLAARATGVDAIDTIYTDIDDRDSLRAETEFALQLGYDGKLAIHPAQIEPIHEAFTPDADRLRWARRVLEASETEHGVFEIDGRMIDAPLVAQAERIVERAGESEVSK